jgi:hypothetical protein
MKKIFWLAFWVILTASLCLSQESKILELKDKIIEIQNTSELAFRNFTFCSNIIGFGSYVPLAKPVVDRNGEILVYYEPLNIFTAKKEGLYEIWYTQDMALLDANGEVLQEWPNILNFHYTTKTPVMDLYAQNNLTLGGKVPAGFYRFKAVLKDKLSGKNAVKVVDFEIR